MISKILPPKEFDIEENKEEIWEDLSLIYFKYDDESQKRAFREVMKEIYEKIEGGRWDEIYREIFRLKNKQV